MRHTVKKGESLHSISCKYYGKGFMWRLIKVFNKDLKDPNKIVVGQRINVQFK